MATSTWKLQFVAAGAAFLLISLLVLRVSSAAFVAETANAGNSWASGQVSLTDDDGGSSGTAMFNVSGMLPGDVVTRCIKVTYSGSSDPAPVKLYGSVTDSGLSGYLDVKVEEGTAATDAYPGCTGFTPSATIVDETLTTFAGRTGYSTGLGTWDPASGTHSQGYRFTVTLKSTTPDSAQGASSGATFTWGTST